MADKKIRVAVYARVSTQEQAVQGNSIEHQSEQLASYFKSRGWQLIQKYVDLYHTGRDANTLGLKSLLADIKFALVRESSHLSH